MDKGGIKRQGQGLLKSKQNRPTTSNAYRRDLFPQPVRTI